jgi:hypothetical protein
MMEANDDAAVDEVPGDECSARMVVRWATQELFPGQFIITLE